MSATELIVAAEFAATKHRDQRRKDVNSSPYINHPIAVAAVLAFEGGVTDETLLVAALLHDTIEDTSATPDEVESRFGAEVLGLVAEVTDDKSLPKAKRKQLQIDHAPRLSARAKQLKLADKICNLRDLDSDSPVGWDAARKSNYLNWAARVVDGCRGVNDKLECLFDKAIADAQIRVNAPPDNA